MKIEHHEDGTLVLTLDWKDGDLRSAVRALDAELGFQPAHGARQTQFLNYAQSAAWRAFVGALR